MILAEIKKTLFGHKGIIVILLLLIYNVYWFYSTNEVFIEHEQYKVFSKCYEKYEGKVGIELLDEIKRDYHEVGDEGYEGAAYQSLIKEVGEKLSSNNVSYIVYYWGWASLMYNSWTNIPLILFGLIFSVIIFAFDAGSKVRNLLNTSFLGRRNLVFSRILVYSGLSFIFVFIQGIVELVMADRLIGVGCPMAPIQSIVEMSLMNISLIAAYMITLMFKLLGLLMGGIVVCFVSSMIKNMYISVIASVMVFFEMYFFSYLYETPYLLPQHLFNSSRYFEGADVNRPLIVTFVVMMVAIVGIYLSNSEKSRRKLI